MASDGNRSMAQRCFISAGRVSGALPPFRGKVRAMNAMYKALGLTRKQTMVTSKLRRPTTYRATLDLQSWSQRLAFIAGAYEADTVEFLLRLSECGQQPGYLLDVGANVGLISVPYAIRMANSPQQPAGGPLAVAIEAVPDNFRALQTNVALNGLVSQVRTVEAALGDDARDIEINVEGDLRAGQGTGTASILPTDSTYVCERQRLQLRRLDDLKLPNNCAVIKIDTDGYDLKVLKGAETFVSASRPVIFGEFSAHCMRWHGETAADVEVFARAHQYLVWQRSKGNWRFSATVDLGTFSQDLLLVPNECLERYSWALDGDR